MIENDRRDRPLVSVIIPVYERYDEVRRAIQSALDQTYPEIEVILVDDASPFPVAESLSDIDDKRLSILRRDKNGGAGAARNTGVEQARGAYVAFLDSDDEWFPAKLERQMQAFDAAHDGDTTLAAMCCGYIVRRAGQTPGIRDELRLPEPVENAVRLVWGCDLSPGTTLVVRRDAFMEVGGFDASFARLEDWDWLIRFAGKHEVGVVSECLCRVNVGARPPSERVLSSTDRMLRAHGSRFAAFSVFYYCRLLSSLYLEKSAAYWHNKDHPKSLLFGILSVMTWPFRSIGFYTNGFKKLFGGTAARPANAHPVRVLHVINSLGPGGAERMLSKLATDSAEEDIEHYIVSLKSDSFYASTLERAGVKYEILRVEDLKDAVRSLWTLIKIIRSYDPHILKSWMYHANIFALVALLLSGKWNACTLIWGIRCSHMRLSEYSFQLRFMIMLSRYLNEFPDLLVANSFRGRDDHIGIGFRRSRFAVLHNGFDTEEFVPSTQARARLRRELGISETAFVVGIVARNDPMKNYPLLISTLRKLDGVVGVAVGRGTEDLPECENLIALGLRTDLPEILNSFDVLVSCSSFGEGLSNSIGEAMSCGVPVIATDVGDSRYLIGTTGIAIPPDDGNALASAIARLRDDPALRRRSGNQARERILTEFSLTGCRRKFLQLFRSGTFGAGPC